MATPSQADISAEIAEINADYDRTGVEESQPRLNYPPYRSSLLRYPTNALHPVDPEAIELSAPSMFCNTGELGAVAVLMPRLLASGRASFGAPPMLNVRVVWLESTLGYVIVES